MLQKKIFFILELFRFLSIMPYITYLLTYLQIFNKNHEFFQLSHLKYTNYFCINPGFHRCTQMQDLFADLSKIIRPRMH
jgi:hypothetical protein